MVDWPAPDQQTVYIPPGLATEAPSEADIRARIAGARMRDGLPVGDEILSEILAHPSSSARNGPGMYTAAEQDDISGDNERVALARTVLAGAESILGGLAVCWRGGRRGVRVLLTAEHERYRRLLSEVLESDRFVIESARFTEVELRHQAQRAMAQSSDLAEQGIFLTRHSARLDGLQIEYLAADPVRAEGILRARFGEFASIRYRGATNYMFRPVPFGSWLAEEHRLHVFYGLPHNGERPGACHAFETERAVIVSLTILDWRGAKTLIGGFAPAHATAELRQPLGDRIVIDDADNRTRPHWTEAADPGSTRQ